MNETEKVGPHSVIWEEDSGIVKLISVGEMNAEHAELLGKAMTRRVRADRPQFMLMDNTQATGMTAEARKTFSQNSKQMSGVQTYLAIYGGSFAFRALANLLMKAMSLSGLKLIGSYHADEPAARAWLAERMLAVDSAAS